MPRHSWPGELEPLASIERALPARRQEPGPDRRNRDIDPMSRRVLDLQRKAGNRAVTALMVAQRQPKKQAPPKKQPPPPPPQWLQDAQAIVAEMAKTDKLMGHVVLRKYTDANKTLQGAEFGAWTNSATAIYLRDPLDAHADRTNKDVQAQAEAIMRFELQHEANHIHQFATAGGPPKTWKKMLEFEKDAYTSDIAFLKGAGKNLFSDPDVLADVTGQVQKNLADVTGLLDGIPKLPAKTNVEQHLLKEMKKLKLIPPGAELDPTKLYKQP
jgi:hypothetical protein